MTGQRGLYRVADAAEYLSLDKSTVYELCAKGDLEKRYVGKGTRNFRIPFESIEAFRLGLPTEAREEAS